MKPIDLMKDGEIFTFKVVMIVGLFLMMVFIMATYLIISAVYWLNYYTNKIILIIRGWKNGTFKHI